MNPIQEKAKHQGVDLDALPTHLAVIMDGNGRWAKGRGLGRLLGHQQGYRTLRDVLLTASDLGVRYLTVYAFSAENWRRPEDEVGRPDEAHRDGLAQRTEDDAPEQRARPSLGALAGIAEGAPRGDRERHRDHPARTPASPSPLPSIMAVGPRSSTR